MNPQEFTERYVLTLHADTDTQENYIKLPIVDLSELAYMQEALLNAIMMLTQIEDGNRKESENSIYWLCKILLAGHPQEELDGLAEWLQSD